MRELYQGGFSMEILKQLHNILKEETALYTGIYNCEEAKSDAIIEKDGRMLETQSVKQESLLKSLSIVETSRAEFLEELNREYCITQNTADLTISMIASRFDSDYREMLLDDAENLKGLILKIQSLSETNMKMMNDNLRFFNMLLSDLKGKVSLKTGYTSRAVEEKSIDNPMIFNTMA
ncbi:MAG TPA: flagellar protein FlgN [Spirochaetota bacterium]|nr:flagellar protein FlgN [Spirochaetota bacterium]